MISQSTHDESLSLGDGSISNSAQAINQDKSKGFITATLLALSIVVNVSCAWLIYTEKQEKRLQQYDLDWFKSTDYAQMKAAVAMQDKVIGMLTIRKECLKP
jgi:hypothetical protein